MPAFDSRAGNTGGTGNLPITLTPVGEIRGIVVDVMQAAAGTDQVSGVTADGVAMARTAALLKATGEVSGVYRYFLAGTWPGGVAITISVVVSGAAIKAAEATGLAGTDDLEVVDSDATINSDSLADPSVVLDHGGRSCFVSLVGVSGHDGPTMVTPLASWTSQVEHDAGTQIAFVYRFDTVGTGNSTAGWMQTAEDAQMIASAFSEIISGGTPVELLMESFTATLSALALRVLKQLRLSSAVAMETNLLLAVAKQLALVTQGASRTEFGLLVEKSLSLRSSTANLSLLELLVEVGRLQLLSRTGARSSAELEIRKLLRLLSATQQTTLLELLVSSTARSRLVASATKILEKLGDGSIVVDRLRDSDELWVMERHSDVYVELDTVDETALVPLEGAVELANSSDFNYAFLQTVRERASGFEVNADELTIYRGNDVKLTKQAKAVPILTGYLVEVAPEDYAFTADAEEATHGLIDTGDGDWSIVPIAELDGSVTLRRIGADTYRGF